MLAHVVEPVELRDEFRLVEERVLCALRLIRGAQHGLVAAQMDAKGADEGTDMLKRLKNHS